MTTHKFPMAGREGATAVTVVDAERDGINTFTEFALKSDPLNAASDVDKLPRITRVGNDLFYQFSFGQDSTSVVYTVKFSHDQQDWTTPATQSAYSDPRRVRKTGSLGAFFLNPMNTHYE